MRVPIPADLRQQWGLGRGDTVDVRLDLDAAPRPVRIPGELRAVFEDDPAVAATYARLPPSCRRAWATYVAEGKQAETRLRRAGRARDGIRARQFPS